MSMEKAVEDKESVREAEIIEDAATKSAWSTSRWELWSFYLYYVVRYLYISNRTRLNCPTLQGNNGLSGFNFGPSQFQNLLFLAGYDPAHPPFTSPCGSGTECVLPFLGKTRNSAS